MDECESIVARELAKYLPGLLPFAALLLGPDAAEAEDICQRTAELALSNAKKYDPSRPFLPWLKAICLRQTQTHFRHKSRSRLVYGSDKLEMLAAALAEETSDEKLFRGEPVGAWLESLRRCFQKEKPDTQALLRERYAEARPLSELARTRRVSKGSLAVFLFRARKTLRECIEKFRTPETEENFARDASLFLEGELREGEAVRFLDSLLASPGLRAAYAAQALFHAKLLCAKLPVGEVSCKPRWRVGGIAAIIALSLAGTLLAAYIHSSKSRQTLQSSSANTQVDAEKDLSEFDEGKESNMDKKALASTAAALFAATVAVKGDVFSDAALWLKFDKNYGDTETVTAASVRDVRDCSTDGLFGAIPQGVDGGPVFTNAYVYCPMHGQTNLATCAHFPLSTNYVSGAIGFWPTVIRLPQMTAPKYATVVARVYIGISPAWAMERAKANTYHQTLFNSALDYNGAKGWEVGFRHESADVWTPMIYVGQSNYYCKDSNNWDKKFGANPMPIENWYDVAWVIRPTASGTTDEVLFAYKSRDSQGIQSSVLNIAKTLKESTSSSYTPIVGGETTGNKYATTATASAQKSFHGLVHQLAVWNRPLSLDEIAEAFAYPGAMFELGIENSSAGEFADVSEAEATFNVTNAPCAMPKGLTDARPSLALKWNARREDSSLPQIFRLKNTQGNATVALEANGAALGNKIFQSATERQWYIPAGTIVNGENTFTLRKVAGETLTFDKIALGGSWQAGYANSAWNEFTNETRAASAFYLGSRNYLECRRDITGHAVSYTNTTLRFSLPASIAGRNDYVYQTKIVGLGGDAATKEKFTGEDGVIRYPLLISVNGTIVFDDQVRQSQVLEVPIAANLLQSGWNEINFAFVETIPIKENTGSWFGWDYHRLVVKDTQKGTVVLLLGGNLP